MLAVFPYRILITILLIPVLMAVGCQETRRTSITMSLQPNNPTFVNFPLTASDQIYSFTANPSSSMQVSLYKLPPDLPYEAEVRDNQGNVLAKLGGNSLQNTILTLGPNTGLYEIAIKASQSPQEGILSLLVGDTGSNAQAVDTTSLPYLNALAATPAYRTITATNPVESVYCGIRNPTGSNVNIRNGPGTNYPVIGTVPTGGSLLISGRTSTGWLQVTQNNQQGWVFSGVVTVEGICNNLPDLTPSAAQNTNPGLLEMTVDRDGWGDFNQSLVYTDGAGDLILFKVSNLQPTLPDNYREFTLTLLCSGTGTEYVRWGAPERPSLYCGHSITVPFTFDFSQQYITVTLADTSGLSNINYTLSATKR